MLSDRILKESRILIVDDDESNVLLLERLLELSGYIHVKSTLDPEEVLSLYESFRPDLILLDLHMPRMDGYEVMKQLQSLRRTGSYLPILVFTADVTAEAKRRALEMGASDFLTKPGNSMEISLRVRNFLETRHLHRRLEDQNASLEEIIQARTRELVMTQVEILERLAMAGEYRDDDTGEHTKRVGELSARIAREMSLSKGEISMIRRTAPLHDLGKIGIPDAILLKPDRLTYEEYEIMKTHTTIGARILGSGSSPLLRKAETIAISHHERWDGSGYPAGLSGEDIPPAGRIVAVADVFDALTHDRPYKKAWTVEEAVAEIKDQRGRQFDPAVVEAFLQVLDSKGHAESVKLAA